MKNEKEIFKDIEIKKGFSLTSKYTAVPSLFQPLPKNRIKTNIYSKILDGSINDILVTKTYETNEYNMVMSGVEMNNTTDELLLLTLLSFNRGFLEVSIKDLATIMGYGKEAGKKTTRDRIMDSLNKLLKCSLNISFDNGENSGFHILKYNYTLNKEGLKTLKVFFDKDFVELYTSSNNGYIDLRVHKELATDYEKSLYSLITNFYSADNKISINKKVMFGKFGDNYLQRDKKAKITKSLKSLKEKGIISFYNISKTGNLVIIKCKMEKGILNKMKFKKENEKMLSNTPEHKAEKLLKLKEITKEDIEMKIEKLNNMANDYHSGLSPRKATELNNKADRLSNSIKTEEEKEEDFFNTLIEFNKEEEEIIIEEDEDDIILFQPASNQRKTVIIK